MNRKSPAARLARAAIALLALGAAACGDSGTLSHVPNRVTLGGVFSLNGNWPSLGGTSKAAMELAVEDVNAYAAGQGVTFAADIRDPRLDPATALAAVQSLRSKGVQVI